MSRPGVHRLATYHPAAEVSLQPLEGDIWGVGCRPILLEPKGVEMRLILCLQARPKAIEHFDAPLLGDCHRRPILLLEPKGADDALGTECTPHHAVTFWLWSGFSITTSGRSSAQIRQLWVFVHAAVKFKMRFIAKPDVLQKGWIRFTLLREPSGKAGPLLLIGWSQLVMDRHFIRHQSQVLSGDSPHGAVAAVDLLGQLPQRFQGVATSQTFYWYVEFSKILKLYFTKLWSKFYFEILPSTFLNFEKL